jgi:mono/diheme cytochrome c family protein
LWEGTPLSHPITSSAARSQPAASRRRAAEKNKSRFPSVQRERKLSSKSRWEGIEMARRAYTILFLVIWPVAAAAQQSAGATDQQQLLGMRLFNQSCRVCHTKPQLASPQYGPVLSMDTLGGKADAIHEVISDGTQRMPGFKYTYKPSDIDAIVAYIKTISAPSPAPPAAGKTTNSREAD